MIGLLVRAFDLCFVPDSASLINMTGVRSFDDLIFEVKNSSLECLLLIGADENTWRLSEKEERGQHVISAVNSLLQRVIESLVKLCSSENLDSLLELESLSGVVCQFLDLILVTMN